jgi:hypothetical protein
VGLAWWPSAHPEGVFDEDIDVTFNIPTSGAATPFEDEDGGILKNLVKIEITLTNKDEQDEKEEVRIYRIVFKDGSTSDYFRYWRRDGGVVYVTLPDDKGGPCEVGYDDSKIQSIKRIRKVPERVDIYGVD